ncbi:MAG: hypothetical protein EOM15_01060 [Spirochaetia bacterium]|nr:hypothetical protein [Spirochaetia bacterium]
MEIQEAISILKQQEEALHFESFTAEDAWELGKIFVADAMDRDLSIAVSIRSMSGKILFHYACEGTCYGSQGWLDRKFNTVKHFEISTLRYAYLLKAKGGTLTDRGLDPTQFVTCGGGFPIFVDGVGVVAAAMVSGLTDIEDHEVLVRCISRFLEVDEVVQVSNP